MIFTIIIYYLIKLFLFNPISDTFAYFQGTYSDEIYEVSLNPPYLVKLLCKPPKPIGNHGTKMINNKIYIFGGKRDGQLYDDVLLYDPVTNECEEISKLPHPLRYMSTVQWKNKVIPNNMFLFVS